MEYLKKVEGEKYLYSHENPHGTQTYFVRKVENGKDTTECLNTTRIGTARNLRDGWVHGRTSKKLGIIEKVEEKGPVLITTGNRLVDPGGRPRFHPITGPANVSPGFTPAQPHSNKKVEHTP